MAAIDRTWEVVDFDTGGRARIVLSDQGRFTCSCGVENWCQHLNTEFEADTMTGWLIKDLLQLPGSIGRLTVPVFGGSLLPVLITLHEDHAVVSSDGRNELDLYGVVNLDIEGFAEIADKIIDAVTAAPGRATTCRGPLHSRLAGDGTIPGLGYKVWENDEERKERANLFSINVFGFCCECYLTNIITRFDDLSVNIF